MVLTHMTTLLETNRVKPVQPECLPDGLAGVRKGLEHFTTGSVPRAKKLVVRLDETPPVDVTLLGTRCELDWNGH